MKSAGEALLWTRTRKCVVIMMETCLFVEFNVTPCGVRRTLSFGSTRELLVSVKTWLITY